jgi:tetratricopeptide (TPR) repeat protein
MLVDDNRRKEAIILMEGMKYSGVRRSDVTIDLAQYYLDEGRYDECIDVLVSMPYSVNWEGSSLNWDIFNLANVKKGIAFYKKGDFVSALKAFDKGLTFPENLGVGRSSRTEEAEAWFWKGKTLLAMGKGKEAMAAWKSGSSCPEGSERQNSYIGFCTELFK